MSASAMSLKRPLDPIRKQQEAERETVFYYNGIYGCVYYRKLLLS